MQTGKPPLGRGSEPLFERAIRPPAENAPRAGGLPDERRQILVRRPTRAETDQLRIPDDLGDGEGELPHRRRPAGADVVERPARALRGAERQREGLGDVVDVVEVAHLIAVRDICRLAVQEPGDEVREQARRHLVAPEDVEETEVDPADRAPFAEAGKQLVLLGFVPCVG